MIGLSGLNFKWLSLTYFIAQNVFLTIGLRYSHEFSDPSKPYISSSVVLCTEHLKLLLSLVLCLYHDAQGDLSKFNEILHSAFVEEGSDMIKLCVPAILYTIQNNLQYVIESAPLFMVVYQMKIITTAVFYTTLLSRRISQKEWFSIIVLACGVGMVQSSQREFVAHHASNIIGILSVILACITSGLAGVYFEKILKSSKSTIWVINIQLSILSCVLSMITSLSSQTEKIISLGFFSGFNGFVVVIILLQAVTGLVIAMVVKVSDNIHKGFANSISIVLSGLVESQLFYDSFDINNSFLLGSFLVVISTVFFIALMNPSSSNEKNSASCVNDVVSKFSRYGFDHQSGHKNPV